MLRSLAEKCFKPRRLFSNNSISGASLTEINNQISFKRSHLLGELSENHLQKEVTLCGWVSVIRNVSKNLFFLLLRDHSGIIQLTLTRTHVPDETFLKLQEAVTSGQITPEAVIAIRGVIQPRPIGMQNESMSTGRIEVFVNEFQILNTLKTKLPFTLNEKYLPNEEIRLQNRFLDLRRPEMQEIIRFRARINQIIRSFFDSSGFVEIETPILFKSSPEGAKEFLIPRPDGLKYALPQSPQQFKQLLMVGGFDKYYQIARCFRDEGMRADRQPEFTQLDMEMAFVDQETLMQTMETFIKKLWKETRKSDDFDLSYDAFERISYDDAMKLYGSDKPDIRFQGKFAFSISDSADENSQTAIEGLLLKGRGRKSFNRDGSFEFCFPIEGLHAKSVISSFHSNKESSNTNNNINDNTNKFWKWHGNKLEDCNMISTKDRQIIFEKLTELGLEMGPRDCLLIQKRDLTVNVGLTDLGRARLAAMQVIKSTLSTDPKFIWVHTFPLLTRASPESLAENPKRLHDSMHHPFTAPNPSHSLAEIFDKTEEFEPLNLRAQHYDLVLNGQEIGGGSVRIHDADLQERIMRDLLGLTDTQIDHFGHLLKALKLGAPPHAGMALGLDRIVAILAGKQSIREVISFPKNSSGFDLCFKAPC